MKFPNKGWRKRQCTMLQRMAEPLTAVKRPVTPLPSLITHSMRPTENIFFIISVLFLDTQYMVTLASRCEQLICSLVTLPAHRKLLKTTTDVAHAYRKL